MSISEPGSRHSDQGPSGWRRRPLIAGVLWLAFAAFAVIQWLLADDGSGARWLAGVQCVLGLALALAVFVEARRDRSGKQPPH